MAMADNKDDADNQAQCSMSDIYNIVQFYEQKLLIDIRPKDQYEQSHVQHFMNIPINSDKNLVPKTILKALNDNDIETGYEFNVYCYSNKHIIDSKLDTNWYKIIQESITQVIQNQTNDINDNNNADNVDNVDDDIDKYEFGTFNVLSIDYETFMNKYKFLCVDGDDNPINMAVSKHYPSMIFEDKLFLGDYGDASSKEVFMDLNITHVVNVSKFDNVFESDLNVKYIHYAIEDDPDAQIDGIFEKCIEFMDNAIKDNNGNNQNKILVHCAAGISRSTTVVIAYLIKIKNMSFDDALTFVTNKRPIVYPNPGFEKQLKTWEQNN